ncbi:MAG TPA: Hsp70 family protein [Vicinamibacterales bacterium]|nr:Hsp70 family protein [Vicinamibacterales bacterium]
MTSPTPWVGIDFGTTNSAVAFVDGDGAPRLAQFPTAQGSTTTFPSVLYFEPRKPSVAGSEAIERYLASETKGRFIQSLKAYLADRTFEGTGIGTQHYSLERLIALIGRHISDRLGLASLPSPRHIVLGRPVHFSNPPDAELDAFAVARLLSAIRLAGFEEIVFEYEPVAAAYAYEARLQRDERILIGDFGGGTSDFTIISIGPGVRSRGRRASDIIGTDGVPIAGDAFDKRLIRNLVAPRLGMGGEYLSPPNKFLPVPSWPYERLERWHYLSFLKSPSTLEMLERVRRTASTPERLEAFVLLINNELGYQLHEAVQRTKFELSAATAAEFAFESGPVTIRKKVTRADFENWIADEIASMSGCVDRLMAASGLGFGDIDRVFLTGGSSFVPAVRQIFVGRFGDAKVTGGEELTSVATGLALRAREQWPADRDPVETR